MSLTSLLFMAFCFVAILIYFVVPKKCQWIVLLVSSAIFLFWNNFSISTVIQALIVLVPTYACGRMIEKYQGTKKSKLYLILGIVVILGQLFYLKYTNLFIATANHFCNLFNIDKQFGFISRNSLIGISYYSLIMIGYMVDIYRGACKSQKNIFKCALFMSYFPILTSGPFIKYSEIEKDLYGEHKFDYDRMCSGLVRALWGAFKVLVVSQRVGMFVDVVYSDINTYSGLFIMAAFLLFTVQLYANFSGSIDIIMGISQVIGIKLPENFNVPFASKTITEFWRNWHITLGAWLRDYIFYPLLKSDIMQKLNKKCKKILGKKRGKKVPLYLSMLIMWMIIGIWHGGAYTFIIGSGILQFVFIFFEDILEPISKKINDKLGIKRDVFSYKLYQVIRTYVLFSFAMIFFRAISVSNALQIIRNMFVITLDKQVILGFLDRIDILDLCAMMGSLFVLFIVEVLSRKGSVREKLSNQNIVFRWVVLYALIFGVIIFGCYGAGYDVTTFIYRNF